MQLYKGHCVLKRIVGQGRGISDTNLFVKIDIYFPPVIRFLCVLQLSPTVKFTTMI